MAVELSSREHKLLGNLYSIIEGSGCAGKAPSGVSAWSMLESVAMSLGYTATADGELTDAKQGQENHTNGTSKRKKRRRISGPVPVPAAAQPIPSQAGTVHRRAILVPPEALTESGEEGYLENFAVHTVDTDKQSEHPHPLAQAVASGKPQSVMEALLWPMTIDHFMACIYQQSAMHMHRPHARSFYAGTFSSEDVWSLLRDHKLEYGSQVDVTLFTAEHRRQTFNFNELGSGTPGGQGAQAQGGGKKKRKRKHKAQTQGEDAAAEDDPESSNHADVRVVRKRFAAGCSVRLLHPQRWSEAIAALLAPLEQLLQCPLGCNVYLTPPDHQGFAPHFDDVDVYILQVEGSKRWRVYAPLRGHALPKFSSRDFDDSEIGEPLLDTVLRPGDLLYLPRGTIHQAEALERDHSMHLTLSSEQRRSWADFLEVAVEEALKDVRKGCFAARMACTPWLPHCTGMLHSNRLSPPSSSASHGATPNGHVSGASDSSPSACKGSDETTPPQADARRLADSRLRELPPQDTLLTTDELAGARSAVAGTVDGLMAALSRVMHDGALDRAADTWAAKFVTERLPPVWLQGSSSEKQGQLRKAYEEGEEAVVREKMRVPAATLACLLDTGDPECLEVRHCLNNTRDAHALGGGDAGVGGDDEDVQKLPFFLVPRDIGPHVAKMLLQLPKSGALGCSRADTNTDSVQGCLHRKQGGGGGSQHRLLEPGCEWLRQQTELQEAIKDSENGEEEEEVVRETVAEVECTLEELGLWR